MRMALIQQSAGPDRDANLKRAVANMRLACEAGARMAVFSELATTRFFPQFRDDASWVATAEPIPGPTSSLIATTAAETRMVTIFNMYELGDDGRRYDASPVFDADGRLLGVTRMVHIADFTGFHEQGYYTPGDHGAPVYETRVGRVGVAVCYDRHYPEYMRALGEKGAQVVAIPQAGCLGEWPEGLYEAEVRTAAFQNGYFIGLCNRVGVEDRLTFAGESFACDPEGRVIARGGQLTEEIVLADLNLESCDQSTARRLFWRDRRPQLYAGWLSGA